MLRGEQVTIDGEFYSTSEAELIPKGLRPNGPPLLIGLLKGGPRMKRLVAQHADHWNCWLASGDCSPQTYRQHRDAMVEACEKHARDPSSLVRNVTPRICPTGEKTLSADMLPLRGSVNEMADALGQYQQLGVDHVSLWPHPNTQACLEALAPVLAATR